MYAVTKVEAFEALPSQNSYIRYMRHVDLVYPLSLIDEDRENLHGLLQTGDSNARGYHPQLPLVDK